MWNDALSSLLFKKCYDDGDGAVVCATSRALQLRLGPHAMSCCNTPLGGIAVSGRMYDSLSTFNIFIACQSLRNVYLNLFIISLSNFYSRSEMRSETTQQPHFVSPIRIFLTIDLHDTNIDVFCNCFSNLKGMFIIVMRLIYFVILMI